MRDHARSRNEQISDILNLLEHAWKMEPAKSFDELLASVVVDGGDDTLETHLRAHLRSLMVSSRDRT